MKRSWRGVAAALAVLAPGGAYAASDAPKPLFQSHEVIHLTIKGPLNRIAASAPTSKAPADGSLAVDGAAPETLRVKLSARGITRRQSDVCSFPPLRVDFPEKPPETSLFKGQKSLKLVTHCQGSLAFQQNMLKEYAAYRIYNVLTPMSFDVRLASIDYVDSSGRPITSRLGFFIEDVKDVAKRNGLRKAATGDVIPITALQSRDAAREAVFQYMIGNLDWAENAGPKGAGCCHNTKLIGPEGAATGLVPVPYDFDFAGLVDAPYATPPEGVPVSDVRERRYRGFCIHNADAQAAAAETLAKRAAVTEVFDSIPELNDRSRREALAYLGSFFDQIAGEKSVADKLLRTCLS